jgi:phosphoribosylanthranilate isomerase
VSTRVKICGITRAEDAALCVAAGVDALGFNFWEGSKRRVRPERAEAIAATLPPEVLRVGVFVRAPPAEVAEVVRRVGLVAVQLHGDEDPADYRDVGAAVWQVVRVDRTLPANVSRHARAVLLDARLEGFGGGGRPFDWSLLRGAPGWNVPLWLAGGLEPSNVAEAIRTARPWGVDVASGVESAPGQKDPEKVRAFLTAVRSVEDTP